MLHSLSSGPDTTAGYMLPLSVADLIPLLATSYTLSVAELMPQLVKGYALLSQFQLEASVKAFEDHFERAF